MMRCSRQHDLASLARGLLLLALAMLWSGAAQAKVEGASPYTLPQTFGAVLRLLRVDLGLEVTEKDNEASYVLFRYRMVGDPKRIVEGAIELIALPNHVKIIVKIPQLPETHERLLRDRLVRKLRDDYGEPPKRVEPSKPPSGSPPQEKPPEKPQSE